MAPRIVLSITILVLISGCSAYRSMYVDPGGEWPVVHDVGSERIRDTSDFVGKRARILTVDGAHIEGDVVRVSDLEIELNAERRGDGLSHDGVENVTIALESVAELEVAEKVKGAAVGTAVIVGVVVYLAYWAIDGMKKSMGN